MTAILETRISKLSATSLEARLGELASLMHDCVLAGASINFILPFSLEESAAFWRTRVLAPALEGKRHVFVAEGEGRIAGSVQLDCATPPNQRHRAEVAKLLVHPAYRRKGIARALMLALEGEAKALGRSLLTLDTRTGDSAEPLYLSMGYETVGTIPGFSRDTVEERLDSTTILYKRL
jgi:GNAT superfamily N-acetyltransferase